MKINIKDVFSKYKKILFILIILISLQMFISVIYPYMTKIIIDDVLLKKQLQNLKTIIIMTSILIILQIPINIGVNFLYSKWSQKVIFDLRMSLSELFLSHKTNSSKNGLFINTITNDCEIVGNQLLSLILNSIPNALLLILYLVILLQLNLKLTLVNLLIIPFFVVLSFIISKTVFKLSKKIQRYKDHLIEFLNGYVRNKLLIDLYGLKVEEQNRFKDNITLIKQTNIYTNTILSFLKNISSLLSVISPLVTLFFGSILVIRKELTIGSLIAFNTYTAMLFVPIGQLLNLPPMYSQMMASIDRINQSKFGVDDFSKGDYKKKNNIFIIDADKLIPYIENVPILKDSLNFKIQEHEIIRIIGPNGVGKSILLKCLINYYEDFSGTITVNKNTKFSYVPQENFLFDGSILDNLTKGLTNWNYTELNFYIDLLQFDISTSKIVTPFTMNLSSGELQKIKLIRALLNHPNVLVLDEALANLDPVIVSKVVNFIKQKRLTTILVYHGNFDYFLPESEYRTIDLSNI